MSALSSVISVHSVLNTSPRQDLVDARFISVSAQVTNHGQLFYLLFFIQSASLEFLNGISKKISQSLRIYGLENCSRRCINLTMRLYLTIEGIFAASCWQLGANFINDLHHRKDKEVCMISLFVYRFTNQASELTITS